MTRTFFKHIALAATLAMAVPAQAVAQDEATTPEDVTWHLTAYADDATASVPFQVQATLLLEDGAASGSTGCNTFSGTYVLDGLSLTFDEAFALTRAACPDESRQQVENGYLAALPAVASWSTESGELRLLDADGRARLTFEEPVIQLTPAAMAQMMGLMADQEAQLERAGERIDDIRIGALRDRIKDLESTVAELQAQAAAAAAGAGSRSGSAFNAREKVLLKAIPGKVARTCSPIRSSLPSGTVAAVACDGARKAVAEMAYYLMEWDDAEATLKSVARANGAPKRNPNCYRQKAGWISLGTQVGAEACFIDGQGKGNFRLITRASGCHQLNVAGTQMREPAIYLALEGRNDRLEPLRAAGLAYTDAGYYLMNFEVGDYIPWGRQPKTPTCRTITDRGL